MSTEYKAALIYGYNLTAIKDNLDGAAETNSKITDMI